MEKDFSDNELPAIKQVLGSSLVALWHCYLELPPYRSQRLNRPTYARLDRGVSGLIYGTSVLQSPHFNLAEQGKC